MIANRLHVTNYSCQLLIATLLMLMASVVNGASFDVQTDQSSVQEGQSFTLKITAEGYPDAATIDLSAIELQFDIINQYKSRRSVITHKGRQSTTTLELELLPKALGEIIIPSLRINSNGQKDFSEALVINVTKASTQTSSNQDVSLDVAINKNSVYLQEEFLLTLTVSHSVNVDFGHLDQEQIKDANIMLVNKKSFIDRIVGRKFIEITYSVKPQKVGTLTTPTFKLPLRTYSRNNSGRRTLVAKPLTLEVKPPPAAWGKQPWLPASKIALSDSLASSTTVVAGTAIERSISVTGNGIYSEQISPIKLDKIEGINIYSNAPLRETKASPAGAIGNYQYNATIIPQKAGRYTLPAIEVDWWDVDEEQSKKAILPKRTLIVTANAAFIEEDESSSSNSPTSEEIGSKAANTPLLPFYYWVIILLLAASLTVAYILFVYCRRYIRSKSPKATEKHYYRHLCSLTESGGLEFRQALFQWAGKKFQRDILNTSDLIDVMPHAETLLQQYEILLFSDANNEKVKIERKQAALQSDIVNATRSKALAKHDQKQSSLKPLYPIN